MIQTNQAPAKQFLFRTNETDSSDMYKGADEKFYEKRYGLPLIEVTEEWAMYVAWMHINRTSGWPCHIPDGGTWINRTVSISKEAQDLQCKMILKIQ